MWLFTKTGFFSIVRAEPDWKWPGGESCGYDTVIIRARVLADLEALEKHSSPTKMSYIQRTPDRDYPFRAYMRQDDFSELLAAIAYDIDYGNFKDAVAKVQGRDRAQWYAGVWSIMQRMGEYAKRFAGEDSGRAFRRRRPDDVRNRK